jgi:branched-chain amino acid aminotransferase
MSDFGPNSLASLDGEIMPVAEAVIPVTDEGLIRGDGAFEVIRIYDGIAYAFEDHMARLQRTGANIRLPIDLEAVRADSHRLLAQAGTDEDAQLLRIMVTRGGRRILLTEQMPQLPDEARLMSVTYSPTRLLDGAKTLSYAANMLAGRLARENGYDEALLVTPHGRVLEAPTSSIFYVVDGGLFTPPLDEHILASITRALVIDVTGAAERGCTLEQLKAADEVFLASTVREVMAVSAIDDQELTGPRPVSAQTAKLAAERIQVELAP